MKTHYQQSQQRFLKITFGLLCCVGLFFSSPVSLFSQTKTKKKVSIKTPSVITKDGWALQLYYYSQEDSKNAKEAPVVVLMHMKGSDSLVWKNGFANQLWEEGYSVIAVDLRKHGQSKPAGVGQPQNNGAKLRPSDYIGMVLMDMDAVKKFIYEEHQEQHLNMGKMAIIAPGMSAPIAANFTKIDWDKRPYDDAPTLSERTPRGQDVRSIVFISPDENLGKVGLLSPLKGLAHPAKRMSMFFIVSAKDSIDKGKTQRFHKTAFSRSKDKKKIFFKTVPGKLRGTALLGKKLKVESMIVKFLELSLKDLRGPQWQDRRSRIVREQD